MKTLIVNSKSFGECAILYDDEDDNLVSRYNWHPCSLGSKTLYVRTGSGVKGYKMIFMHRLIMGVQDPKIFIDHKNRNGLDNRRCNLRFATKSQNAQNQPKIITNTTGYKGVTKTVRSFGTRYRCRIVFNGNVVELGNFLSDIEAAKAYNEAALKYFGEFAYLNEIPISACV